MAGASLKPCKAEPIQALTWKRPERQPQRRAAAAAERRQAAAKEPEPGVPRARAQQAPAGRVRPQPHASCGVACTPQSGARRRAQRAALACGAKP